MKYTVGSHTSSTFSFNAFLKGGLALFWTCLIITAGFNHLTIAFFLVSMFFGSIGYILFRPRGQRESVNEPINGSSVFINNDHRDHYLSVFID